jgi:hypothetical protein
MQPLVLLACLLLLPVHGFLNKHIPRPKGNSQPITEATQEFSGKRWAGLGVDPLSHPAHGVARTPAMGFNSYDSYDWMMTEGELFHSAEVMRDRLLPSGYNTITLDWYWYRDGRAGQRCPGCLEKTGLPTNRTHQLYYNEHGFFYPDPIRFPSTASTKSWKPIVDRLAEMGIKLGLHLMPGVTRFAVDAGLSVPGMPDVPIADIVDYSRSPRGGIICANCTFYKLDMKKRGAQHWYDACISQLADAGIRYIKLDFIPAEADSDNIQAVAAAIKKTGAPIEFNVHGVSSPKTAAKIGPYCNSYRITSDVHDNWHSIEVGLKISQVYAEHHLEGAPGLNGFSWPDHDMLPLGLQKPKLRPQPKLKVGDGREVGRPSDNLLTADEQQFLMTLWGMTRSPLIYGGRLDNMSDATVALLTKPEIIALNRDATAAPWPLRKTPPSQGWIAGARAYKHSRRRRFAGLGYALEPCDPNDSRQRWNMSRLSTKETSGGVSQEGEEAFAGTASEEAVQLHFDFSKQNPAAPNVCIRLMVWNHNCSNTGINNMDLMDCKVNHCDGRSILWKLPASSSASSAGSRSRRGQITSDLTGGCLTANWKEGKHIAVEPCKKEKAPGQTWLVQEVTAAPPGESIQGLVTIEETTSGRCLAESSPLEIANTWVGQVQEVLFVAFFNVGAEAASMGATFEDLRLGKNEGCFARNVWLEHDLGLLQDGIMIPNIPSHGVALIELRDCTPKRVRS